MPRSLPVSGRRRCGIERRAEPRQVVAHPVPLGAQVAMFSGVMCTSSGTCSTTVRPWSSIPARLAGLLVSSRTELHPEVGEDLRPDAVVARVGRQPEVEVRVDGVAAAVLQPVGGELVHQADAPALVAAQVDHDAAALVGDGAQRCVQLRPAVAAQRAEDVAGQALGVQPDQHVRSRRRGRRAPARRARRTSTRAAVADGQELAVPRRAAVPRPSARPASRCAGGRSPGRRSTPAPARARRRTRAARAAAPSTRRR